MHNIISCTYALSKSILKSELCYHKDVNLKVGFCREYSIMVYNTLRLFMSLQVHTFVSSIFVISSPSLYASVNRNLQYSLKVSKESIGA